MVNLRLEKEQPTTAYLATNDESIATTTTHYYLQYMYIMIL